MRNGKTSNNYFHTLKQWPMCVSRKYSDPRHGGNFSSNPLTPSDFPFSHDEVNPLCQTKNGKHNTHPYQYPPYSMKIQFLVLAINMFWALLRAHFNPPQGAQAKMILSGDHENICMSTNINHFVFLT